MFPYDLNDITLIQLFQILDDIKPIIEKFKNTGDDDIWCKNTNSHYFSIFLSRFFDSTYEFYGHDLSNLEANDGNIIFNISMFLFNFGDDTFSNTPQSKNDLLSIILSERINLPLAYEIPNNLFEKLNSNSLAIFDRSFWNSEILPILDQRGINFSHWDFVKLSQVFSTLI